jgi:hypothetical protein
VTHLLDTDTCIGVLRQRPGMVQRLNQVAPTDCAVSNFQFRRTRPRDKQLVQSISDFVCQFFLLCFPVRLAVNHPEFEQADESLTFFSSPVRLV